MKRFLYAPLVAFAALGLAACDSGDDSSDADVFVGTHTVVKLEDNATTSPRDLTGGVICSSPNPSTNPPTCTVNAITFQFREAGTYRLNVDYTNLINAAPASAGGRQDVTFDNALTTYTVNESAKTITLKVPTGATSTLDVQAAYTIAANNRITLSLPSAVFNTIFGTTLYQGTVRVTVQK